MEGGEHEQARGQLPVGNGEAVVMNRPTVEQEDVNVDDACLSA